MQVAHAATQCFATVTAATKAQDPEPALFVQLVAPALQTVAAAASWVGVPFVTTQCFDTEVYAGQKTCLSVPVPANWPKQAAAVAATHWFLVAD